MRESDRPPSSLAWQIDIDIGEASTSPPQGEAGAVLGLKQGDDDLFEQRSQQLLAIRNSMASFRLFAGSGLSLGAVLASAISES